METAAREVRSLAHPIVVGGAAIAALLVLLASGFARPTQAQQTTSLSIDALPQGNTAASVAEINACASAQEGDTFDVDLVIENVTDLLAWEIAVTYDPEVLEVRESEAEMFQAANEGSVVQDLSEATPDDDGRYLFQAVDIAEPKAPDSGSGVLARLTLEARGSGTSELAIEKVDLDDDGAPDQGPLLRDVAGDIIGDDDGDTLFDGPVNGAEIRVGDLCPESAATVQPIGDDDGVSVALVIAAALGGVAALAIVAALGAFLLRRRAAGP